MTLPEFNLADDPDRTARRCTRCGATVMDACAPCDSDRAAFLGAFVSSAFQKAASILRPGDGDATGFGDAPTGDAWLLLDEWLEPRGLRLHGDERGWRVVRKNERTRT